MKREEDTGGFIDFGQLDPAVASTMGAAARRAADRAKTPAQRKRAARDRARNRRMVDLPAELESRYEAMAAELGVSFSSLISYVLASSLPGLDVAAIRAARVHSRSMRFEYVLPVGEK